MNQTKKRNRGGRPSKRTPRNAKLICDGLARGLPFTHACAVARVSLETFSSWRKNDEAFRQRVERAIAQGVDARLKKIEAASEAGDWRASAWLLEHCQPEHFAKNRLEVTGAGGAPLMAGVQLYLPKKNDVEQGTVIETPPVAAIAERSANGNGN